MASVVNSTSISSSVSRRQRAVDFLARWRFEITATIIAVLVVEDFVMGFKPHDLADVHNPQSLAGLALVLLGLSFRTWAAGTPRVERQLLTAGPYSLVRHPLYLGSFTMMIGFCIIIDDPENIWFVFGPFLYLYWLRIKREERRTAERFDTEWSEYVRVTPPFLPRRLSKQAFGGWSLKQWIRSGEYRFVGPTLLGLVALKLWHAL